VLPLLHGLDSVHGAIYVYNSTIFPHQHALGATFNPDFARTMGRVTAQDTMAGGESWGARGMAGCVPGLRWWVLLSGVQWIFGPILDLGNQPRWSRMVRRVSCGSIVDSKGRWLISGSLVIGSTRPSLRTRT
jgi:beta-glucosidase